MKFYNIESRSFGENNLLNQVCCPISRDLIHDPVQILYTDGEVSRAWYEKAYLKDLERDPLTRQQIAAIALVPLTKAKAEKIKAEAEKIAAQKKLEKKETKVTENIKAAEVKETITEKRPESLEELHELAAEEIKKSYQEIFFKNFKEIYKILKNKNTELQLRKKIQACLENLKKIPFTDEMLKEFLYSVHDNDKASTQPNDKTDYSDFLSLLGSCDESQPVVEFLSQVGVDFADFKDNKNNTAIYYASENYKKYLLLPMLKNRPYSDELISISKIPPIKITSTLTSSALCFITACCEGYKELVEKKLKANPFLANVTTQTGEFIFSFFSDKISEAINEKKSLLENMKTQKTEFVFDSDSGFKKISEIEKEINSLEITAKEISPLLISFYAEHIGASAKSETVFSKACKRGDVEEAIACLNANFVKEEEKERWLFFYACIHGYIKIIRKLWNKSQDVINEKEEFTGLELALISGNYEKLPEEYQKNIDLKKICEAKPRLVHLILENALSLAVLDFLKEHNVTINVNIEAFNAIRVIIERNADFALVERAIKFSFDFSQSAFFALCNLDINARGEAYLSKSLTIRHPKMTFVQWTFNFLLKNNKPIPLEFLKPPFLDKQEHVNMFLLSACCYGNTEIVRLLLENKADVNVRDDKGFTPLHVACEMGHKEIVECLLLHKGVDVNLKNNTGFTALHWAYEKGHKEIVRLLLEHGADVNAANDKGLTLLHIACSKGHKEIVECLLHKGVDVNLKNNTGFTALHWACEKGHLEIVRLLLEKKADVNAANNIGVTPLHWVCNKGHKEIIKILIQYGANVNLKGINDNTLLHWACEKGHLEIVFLLLEKNANVNERNNEGCTPLHYACKNGHKEIVLLLLEKKVDVNAKTNKGNTPVAFSLMTGHSEITNLLILKNADVRIANESNETSLHWACYGCSDLKIISTLIENYQLDVSAKTNVGSTMLHFAAHGNNKEAIKFLIEKYELDINAVTNEEFEKYKSMTALHIACVEGHIEAVETLLDLKADPKIKDGHGKTALEIATKLEIKAMLGKHLKKKKEEKRLADSMEIDGLPSSFPKTDSKEPSLASLVLKFGVNASPSSHLPEKREREETKEPTHDDRKDVGEKESGEKETKRAKVEK